MPTPGGAFTHHVTEVHAPAAVLWDVLVDKIRRPDKYVPGVTDVKVVKEFSDLSILREMTVDGSKVVKELIVGDPVTKTVLFKTVDDPKMRGFVLNTIFEEGDKVFLDYTMNWSGITPDAPDMQEAMSETIKKATEHTASVAAEKAKAS